MQPPPPSYVTTIKGSVPDLELGKLSSPPARRWIYTLSLQSFYLLGVSKVTHILTTASEFFFGSLSMYDPFAIWSSFAVQRSNLLYV